MLARGSHLVSFGVFLLALGAPSWAAPPSAPLPAEGNGGSERGGGDPEVQKFVTVAHEAADFIAEWRKRDPDAVKAVDLELLRSKIGPVDREDQERGEWVFVFTQDKCYIKRRGIKAPVDMINDLANNTLALSRPRLKELWKRPKTEQFFFVLHEYFKFMGVFDEQYQATHTFLARLSREKELDTLRAEAIRRLHEIAGSVRATYQSQELHLKATLAPIRRSSDYEDCAKPGHAEACVRLTEMVRAAGQTLRQQPATTTDELLQDYSRFVGAESSPARRRLLETSLQELTEGLRGLLTKFNRRSQELMEWAWRCPPRGDQSLACVFGRIFRISDTYGPRLVRQSIAGVTAAESAAVSKIQSYYEPDAESAADPETR